MNTTFIGLDPGFTGAIGFIGENGEQLDVWDLPVIGDTGRARQFDLLALNNMIFRIAAMEDAVCNIDVGLENPTTRPGEGAERCKRFGEGIGLLKGMMTAHRVQYKLISPNLWKGRLGLPGKQIKGANKACAQYLVTHYPNAEHLIYGTRGGVKDGRLDALLIAHWMRIEYENKS